MSKKLILSVFIALLSLPSGRAQAATWEEYTLERLVNRELAFFGVDADVKRLLDDPTFEEDLIKWWTVVNPAYVEEALKGGYEEDEIPDRGEIRSWAAASRLERNAGAQYRVKLEFAKQMRDAMPSDKGRMYLAYFLRTNQAAKAKSLLRIYLQSYALFARELLQDARRAKSNAAAETLIRGMAALVGDDGRGVTQATCLRKATPAEIGECLAWQALSPAGKTYVECVGRYRDADPRTVGAMAQCMKTAVQFKVGSTDLIAALGYEGPGRATSLTGYMEGNEVTYFTENRHDPAMVSSFERLYAGEANPVKEAAGELGLAGLERALRAGSLPFSGATFPDASAHDAFQLNTHFGRNQAIFPEILWAIGSAKHTIFVDVFFLGGTMGSAVARELMRKADAGVKVFLIKDMHNSFAYKDEMDPVFDTLMAYSRVNPAKMVVAPAYIFAHRTGLPKYFDALVPDHVADSIMKAGGEAFSFAPPLFPKAKSDHSKVMVIDGAGMWADSLPFAYVGSKNWTDSSGALTFDEVARVIGPAAVAVQDSYYWDFWYALRAGGRGRDAMDPARIETALADFDPLARKWDARAGRSVPTRQALTAVGARAANRTVRLGMNNINGSETSALDQNIYAIRMAKKQIVINDQFLYDRRIVDELIDKATRDPGVRIYIMLEPISKTSGVTAEPLGGFPNTLYADLLTYKRFTLGEDGRVSGTERWPNIQLKWKHVPHSDEFHMEYHMKTISVDGFDAEGRRIAGAGAPILISGSANKDHMTMHGAFREMQVEVQDDRACSGTGAAMTCGAVAEADRVFWRRWNNRSTEAEGGGSEELDPFRFQVPPQIQGAVKKALRRDMTPAEFLAFARTLVHGAYDLESRANVE